MKNITNKEYKEIRDKTVDVVSFLDGKRTLTYGNLSYKKAIEHLKSKTFQGEVCLVFENGVLPIGESSWDFEDYKKYMEDKK